VSLPIAVLAGGLATRLGAEAREVPKILVDVAGRPFAEHQLALLKHAGIRHVVYCLGHLGDRVVEVLGDGGKWDMHFDYVHDGPTLVGTGGALRRALPHLGPAFFVMYGDSYLECDFRDVEATFEGSGQPGLMTVFKNDNRFDRSNVAIDGGRIAVYDKASRHPGMDYIDYGLGVLTPSTFEPWRDVDRFDLAVVYQRLVAAGALASYEVTSRFYEIGSPDGLSETREMLARRMKAVQ